jgi:hypothetical protein
VPLSRAKLHCFELPVALLDRGFWLYLWKIQEGHNTRPIFYVGMTGDTGSYSAQSPINKSLVATSKQGWAYHAE